MYFPNVTRHSIHECLLHVDEEHCGNPARDWLNLPVDPDTIITLTKQEKEDILRSYDQVDREIKPKDDCLIGLGYNVCEDIGFRAVDLFEAIRGEVSTLQAARGTEFVPQVH